MEPNARIRRRFAVLLMLLALDAAAAPLGADESPTRAEELRARREEKARAVAAERGNRAERFLLQVKERHVVERLTTPGAGFHGLRPKLGGLSTGSGFAGGVVYDRLRLAGGALDLSASAAASLKGYELYDLKLAAPRLARGRLFAHAYAAYRDAPQEDFYGLGPRSSREDRVSFRLEDVTLELAAGARPLPWLRLGASGARIEVDLGPGTDDKFPSLEAGFADSSAPGLDAEPDFLRGELFAEVDWRDVPGNARSGGFYRVAYGAFDERDGDGFDFARWTVEAQQFVPFNHGHRVLALRLRTVLDEAEEGSRVPFYLQRTLGGAGDLRGFEEFRFRDENQLLLNVEYRWEAWLLLDMALFFDAGKVFRDRDELDLDDLETDFGFGFRFKSRRGVFLRIDVAHSDEDTPVFVKFQHVF